MDIENLKRLRGWPVDRTRYLTVGEGTWINEVRLTTGEVRDSAKRISADAWRRVLKDRELAAQRRSKVLG